ncbi:unnamed protein product [Eruca vesicaria subsp. sativa]|uniref:Uncharacterized protein n=1 Tax=Eruca vesicaria subsp. sativa TaxID=29727 RepID=A0ABC8L3C7_ERUVS|nr:unnamed protein product [Eruca vesicaria subsp. sativa]
MPSLSPKPKPNTKHSLLKLPKLLKDDNNKQKKGSQFAKFIAETQEMFVKPKLSRDVIPSNVHNSLGHRITLKCTIFRKGDV